MGVEGCHAVPTHEHSQGDPGRQPTARGPAPKCIAANVIRALEHPDLEDVALRARALVVHEFTFEKVVERWKKVLEEVGDEGR